MIRFLVVEPTHSSSNFRFDVSVVYLQIIILSVICDVPSIAMYSLTDFVNLKINPVQSFKFAHRDRVYTHIFI
jgi:hypothetical protein